MLQNAVRWVNRHVLAHGNVIFTSDNALGGMHRFFMWQQDLHIIVYNAYDKKYQVCPGAYGKSWRVW